MGQFPSGVSSLCQPEDDLDVLTAKLDAQAKELSRAGKRLAAVVMDLRLTRTLCAQREVEAETA